MTPSPKLRRNPKAKAKPKRKLQQAKAKGKAEAEAESDPCWVSDQVLTRSFFRRVLKQPLLVACASSRHTHTWEAEKKCGVTVCIISYPAAQPQVLHEPNSLQSTLHVFQSRFPASFLVQSEASTAVVCVVHVSHPKHMQTHDLTIRPKHVM